MRVLVDNDLPPRLARALHIIFEDDGDEIIALRDKFGRDDVKDADWIGHLGPKAAGQCCPGTVG